MGFAKRTGVVAACFFLAFLASVPAWGASYYVAAVQGEGIDPEILDATRQLVLATIPGTGNTISDITADPAAADFTLSPRLFTLGHGLIMTLTKSRPVAGRPQTVFMSRAQADAPEDLDAVSARLTRAVIKNEDPEAIVPTSKAYASWTLGMGPFVMENVNVPLSRVAYSLVLGRQWEVIPDFTINLDYEFSSSDWSYLGALELGGNYYFGKGATAPYVGVDFGDGYASTSTANNFGLSLGARAGVLFFRNSDTQLSVELRQLEILIDIAGGYVGSTGLCVAVHY